MTAALRELTPEVAREPSTAATLSRRQPLDVALEEFGELTAVGRPGGQGRVYRAARAPGELGARPIVVKLYRRPPATGASLVLGEMIEWSRSLEPVQNGELQRVAAWPVATVSAHGRVVGIAMHDATARFVVPFTMPSGRREGVLPSLEHLLGPDTYLEARGLGVRLDTETRARVAEAISGRLAWLHRHAIVVSDIAPNNLLVGFRGREPDICFIDCDSMAFRGRQALPAVQTADWQTPPSFDEGTPTRATDAYKLGLVVLRLFARSHDARAAAQHLRHVPAELHELLSRALGADTANRPPAGEWQRALHALVATGALNHRYPGPVTPRPRTPAAGPGPGPAPRRVTPTPAAPIRAVHRPAAPGRAAYRPAASRRNKTHPLTVAWVVLATVIFAMLLARLLANAVPPQDSFSSGQSGTPTYQYYPPGGGGSGIP
jgi:hypothetical protein